MDFFIRHTNLNVLNLEKSLSFYAEALGLREIRRITADDGSYILVYLDDAGGQHELELTWLRDRETPYALGDNEGHIAFEAENFEGAKVMHKKMGCVCYENEAMGIYFIEDPDGYWMEVVPPKKAKTK